MTEAQLLHALRLELGQLPHVTVWRNNVGVAKYPGRAAVPYGLCSGASDIIGMRSLLIGPEHTGATIAQFVAVEVKTPIGRLTQEQKLFLALVQKRGGLALCARDIEEARKVLSE